MNVQSLWQDAGSTLEKVVLAIALGFIAGAIIMLYNKRAVGKLVRELIKRGASSPATALTAAELGLKPRASLKSPNSAIRKLVRAAPAKEGDSPDRALSSAELARTRFYLPEDDRIRAELRYDAKNTTLPIVILTVIGVGVAAYLCIRYIPQLLEFRLFEE